MLFPRLQKRIAVDGGTKGRRDGGTEGRRDGGTEGQRDGGTAGRRDGGTDGGRRWIPDPIKELIERSGVKSRLLIEATSTVSTENLATV